MSRFKRLVWAHSASCYRTARLCRAFPVIRWGLARKLQTPQQPAVSAEAYLNEGLSRYSELVPFADHSIRSRQSVRPKIADSPANQACFDCFDQAAKKNEKNRK